MRSPFAPENGQPLRFKIGDAVIFTNEYGAQFRLRVTRVLSFRGVQVCSARRARLRAGADAGAYQGFQRLA
jgi:hypothetical protein